MWILLRFAFAITISFGRYFWPKSHAGFTHQGAKKRVYFFRQTRSKNKITGSYYGLACTHPIFLRLTPERAADRLFKVLGFSRELQTGDAIFDRTVYVACDHPALPPLLQTDTAARDAIRATFEAGVTKIFTDGNRIWAYRAGITTPMRPPSITSERSKSHSTVSPKRIGPTSVIRFSGAC